MRALRAPCVARETLPRTPHARHATLRRGAAGGGPSFFDDSSDDVASEKK
jgi:hypothetical protein